MVLEANDRRTSCPCHDEFCGPLSDYVRQVALATTTTTTTTSHCSATRGLLMTDHVILNHGQLAWTIPAGTPLLTTTPMGDVSALDRFNVHRCPTPRVFSGTGLELVIRYLYHSATAATRL
ncbi:uncharacterized protein TNCV_5069351 [Trichonephila clavipes]|nr:uncharacterized protein TNCV_5069351 [Trichonephila clavipes]